MRLPVVYYLAYFPGDTESDDDIVLSPDYEQSDWLDLDSLSAIQVQSGAVVYHCVKWAERACNEAAPRMNLRLGPFAQLPAPLFSAEVRCGICWVILADRYNREPCHPGFFVQVRGFAGWVRLGPCCCDLQVWDPSGRRAVQCRCGAPIPVSHPGRQVEDQLDRTIVRAPFDGVITERLREAGGDVNRSEVLVHMLDTENLEGRVFVPVKYLPFLRQAKSIKITANI